MIVKMLNGPCMTNQLTFYFVSEKPLLSQYRVQCGFFFSVKDTITRGKGRSFLLVSENTKVFILMSRLSFEHLGTSPSF